MSLNATNGVRPQYEDRSPGWGSRVKLLVAVGTLVGFLFGGAATAVAIGAKVASFATQGDVESAASESEVRDRALDKRVDELELNYGRIDERLRSIQRAVGAGG